MEYVTTPNQRANAYKQARKTREFVRRVKSLGHCADCGGNFPAAAMDFHHIDPTTKVDAVSRIKGFQKVKAEIRKCLLLCANCHRVREAAFYEL